MHSYLHCMWPTGNLKSWENTHSLYANAAWQPLCGEEVPDPSLVVHHRQVCSFYQTTFLEELTEVINTPPSQVFFHQQPMCLMCKWFVSGSPKPERGEMRCNTDHESLTIWLTLVRKTKVKFSHPWLYYSATNSKLFTFLQAYAYFER